MKRTLLHRSAVLAACAGCFLLGAYLQEGTRKVTREDVEHAERIAGLTLNDAKRDSMLSNLDNYLNSYEAIRKVDLKNSIPPAFQFNPIPAGMKIEKTRKPFKASSFKGTKRPVNLEDVAFYSVGQLAEL